MSPAPQFSLDEIMPHRAPMRFIEEVVVVRANHLTSSAVIREHNIFLRQGHLGAWVGIEYMAQTIAALAGWEARLAGDAAPPIGFLLGSRRFEARLAQFAVGATLVTRVTREVQTADGMGAFHCELDVDGVQAAIALVTVFSPPDPERFVSGLGSS